MKKLKVYDFQVLRLKVLAANAWLCFPFRLNQFHLDQCGLELREILLPLPPPVLGLKVYAITA